MLQKKHKLFLHSSYNLYKHSIFIGCFFVSKNEQFTEYKQLYLLVKCLKQINVIYLNTTIFTIG
jgi:hypothetical protein